MYSYAVSTKTLTISGYFQEVGVVATTAIAERSNLVYVYG
jgi:hypothetical protein